MQLNTSFEMSAGLDGDQLKPSDVTNHPLIVKVYERRDNLTTKFKPNGDGSAVLIDVLDMATNQVYINVMWFNGALVDNLSGYAKGDALAIKLIEKTSKSTGNSYLVPEALTGDDLGTAQKWAAAKPKLFEETRDEREIPQHGGALGGGQLPAAGSPAQQAQAQQPPAQAPQAQQAPPAVEPAFDTSWPQEAPNAATAPAPAAAPAATPAAAPAAAPAQGGTAVDMPF